MYLLSVVLLNICERIDYLLDVFPNHPTAGNSNSNNVNH